MKWFLAIPHFFLLAFLWLAFLVTTFVAWWAILFTARYPRGLFHFNVGVLRWTWRVTYYATSGIGTDKYPPFSLQPADYPATLDIAYPERLSRGLIFVKWLLIVPHWIIVGFFIGGGWYVRERANGWGAGASFGLIGWVTIIAGVALLFTGRYPKGLYDFVMGMNRWVVRAFVYPALMTDHYPPFTLDQGPTEPVAEQTPPSSTEPQSWPHLRLPSRHSPPETNRHGCGRDAEPSRSGHLDVVEGEHDRLGEDCRLERVERRVVQCNRAATGEAPCHGDAAVGLVEQLDRDDSATRALRAAFAQPPLVEVHGAGEAAPEYEVRRVLVVERDPGINGNLRTRRAESETELR